MTASPLRRLADALAPLALVAAVLALVAPSRPLARRSDVLLATLVLFSALGITTGQLLALRARWTALVALSIGPLLVLAPLAWALSRAFASPTREGVLTLGLSSSEIATIGLVSLAAGDAALALGAVTGSLILAALAGPLVAATTGGDAAQASSISLLARFAVIVLLPPLAGLTTRHAMPRIARAETALAAAATLTVVVLIYAAISGLHHGRGLAAALLGAGAFLAISSLVALAAGRVASPRDRAAITLTTGLRDFAVAAALANQAFGPPAATVAGLYGVLMLITGTLIATTMRRHATPVAPAG